MVISLTIPTLLIFPNTVLLQYGIPKKIIQEIKWEKILIETKFIIWQESQVD